MKRKLKKRKPKISVCLKCGEEKEEGKKKPDWCIDCNKKYVKYRNCLSCGKRFLSEGAHNRLCKICRVHNYRIVQSDILRISSKERQTY